MADVESCVRTLKEDEDIIDHAIRLNNKLKESVSKFPDVTVGEFENFKADPCKTIIRGFSGHELSDILDVMRINAEKSTPKCIVITTHIYIMEDEVDQLITAIKAIMKEHGITEGDQAMRGEEPKQLNPIYKKILTKLRFMYDILEVNATHIQELSAIEAEERISAEIKYRCTPGFPNLVYGEEIFAENIELFGTSKKLKVMKHCDSLKSTSTTDSQTSWGGSKLEKFEIINSDQ